MKLLLILPILIPLATAALCLLFWRLRAVQRLLGLLGCAAHLAAALLLLVTVWHEGIFATQLGNWPAPFGITLVADLFSAVMVLIAGLTGFLIAVYALAAASCAGGFLLARKPKEPPEDLTKEIFPDK